MLSLLIKEQVYNNKSFLIVNSVETRLTNYTSKRTIF